MNTRKSLTDAKRVVVKIGSSMLTRPESGRLDLLKMERLIRELCTLKNQGKEIILVSSGAIAVGRQNLGLERAPKDIPTKQACASIGQGRLMMVYQKLFSEYSQLSSQVLMTKSNLEYGDNKRNIIQTFHRLLELDVIPIVNENDTVSTYEMQFGDNDTLSATVATLVDADLLILLSDIDGFFTDDPNTNPKATLIDTVDQIDDRLFAMAKDSSSSDVGTGGMAAKLNAASIATEAGCHMVIANGTDVGVIHQIMEGKPIGTLFIAQK